MDSSTEVLLQSKNPGVLGVGPGEPTDAEKSRDEENWTFVIFGVAPGQTEVQVFIDGTLEAHIPATVGAQ